ncbi:YCF48-related protein [Paenibacillus sp. NPDC058177]|uniref:YCF48-related protein n=1 Tax=Paenibacillus sp. NPDC058177 TaxID=3346369 RepID=UPI0036D8C80E
MNWTHHWHRAALTLFSAGLLALSGWGTVASSAPAPQSAAAGTPVCGTGDHGLLENLQKKHAQQAETPLTYSDIAFLNSETGRAVGNGFMIGTSDGGCHFQEIYHGQWNFKGISFPDNVHGWAIASIGEGQANYLIASTDGGSTWKNLSGKATAFDRIDFTDSKNGFAYSRNAVFTTKDSGQSWTEIPTPANTRGAYFSSPSSGWSVVVAPGKGYRVMKTTDGGSTWKLSLQSRIAYPTSGEIYAKGNQVYALLYGDSGMSQTSYSLYASSDKGGSWKRVIAQATAGGGPAPGSGSAQLKSGPASGRPGNMQLVGNSTAFLVGYSPAGEQVAVGRTVNGGKAWSNLKPIQGFEGTISFPDSKHGWLAVREQDQSAVYATADGGSTWKQRFAFKDAVR